MRKCCEVYGGEMRPRMSKGPDNGWAWMLGTIYQEQFPGDFVVTGDGYQVSRRLKDRAPYAFEHVMKFAKDNDLDFDLVEAECDKCQGHPACVRNTIWSP